MESETLTGGTDDSKVFNDAPIFMRESLTFPYSYGLNFVVKLMAEGRQGKGLCRRPCRILRTPRGRLCSRETYLSGEKIEPMPVARIQARLQGLREVRYWRDGRVRCRGIDRAICGKEFPSDCIPNGGAAITTQRDRKTTPRRPRVALCVALGERGESLGVCRDLCALAQAAVQEGGGGREIHLKRSAGSKSGTQSRVCCKAGTPGPPKKA